MIRQKDVHPKLVVRSRNTRDLLMSDYDFEMISAGNGCVQQAMWHGVYRLLTNRSQHSDVAAMAQSVQEQWRNRVMELHEAGWIPATEDQVKYLRNCPPIAIKPRVRSRPCSRSKTCPFCWGRRVVANSWTRVANCYFKDKQYCCPRLECDLLRFRYERSFKSLDDALQDERRSRHYEVKAIRSEGAFSITSFLPEEDGFTLRRSGVLLVNRGRRLPRLRFVTSSLLHTYTKEHLAEAIGAVCRFPVAMMRCPAEQAKQVLHATANMTQLRFQGSLLLSG